MLRILVALIFLGALALIGIGVWARLLNAGYL